jgi:predicted TIM-barrel fold metal-dependent hydrolase
MLTRIALILAAISVPGSASVFAQDAPLADHHQHLFSPALAALFSPPAPAPPLAPITARDLIPLLDAAGMKRAVVLSTAYIWSQPSRKVENDYERVKADNDWTSEQVAQFPSRLIGFCGLNPLRDYALPELARCARDPNLRNGLKIHMGNSAVDYHNAQHVQRLREVLRAANGYRMAIVIHMRASITEKLAYGRDEALVLLNVLDAAPDVPVQIAHLAGAGGFDDPLVDQALGVFVEAIQRQDPRATRLWFDVTSVALDASPETLQRIAARIRQLGVQRVLYGSDGAVGANTPQAGWAAFRKVPLTAEELRTIASNVPPYLR